MKTLSTFSLMKKSQSAKKIEISGQLLSDVQAALLEMLKDFASVCDKHGYYYSLSGGTALGAVRHGGFIPWDDDVDVFMVRKDYNAFLSVFDKELGDKYYINSPSTTPEIGVPITQIMKKGTVFRTYNTPSTDRCGLYIDVFVLENAPPNKLLRTLHGLISLGIGYGLSCARFDKNKESLLSMFDESETEIIDAINKKARVGKLFRFSSVAQWARRYEKWNSICRNDDSKYVVCPTGLKHYFNYIFPRDIYCTTKKLKFEDTELSVVANYDWALSNLYGDYMNVPPPEKREKHYAIEVKV